LKAELPSGWRSKKPQGPDWPPPNGTVMPIYLISPNGDVDTIWVPPEASLATGVQLTRIGAIWTTFNGDYHGGHIDATWLWHDGKLEKVLDRQLPSISASPDGCKLAYFDMSEQSRGIATAKILNFCSAQ
jgi:hypothetical protein